MQLATIIAGHDEVPVLVDPGRGVVRVDAVLDGHFSTAMDVLTAYSGQELEERLAQVADARFRPADEVRFTAPYRRPHKIWGIGLNYVEHARDLTAAAPTEPASFIKGDHTIIGPGDEIPLPWQSERVTAEAELGLVIGRYCRDVGPEQALAHVWGVVPVLDQTAEDILARNPRFLTRSKNFPGFFSFGPQVTPLHHVLARFGELAAVRVSTVRNGIVQRSNTVANMLFSPEHLVSFHSQVMPLYPGDIISTGTPGAVQVRPGDIAECRIDGIGTLHNPVVAGAVAAHDEADAVSVRDEV